MTIESQTGGTRYRQHPDDKRRVQVQHAPGARWQDVCNDDGSVKTFVDAKGSALWIWQQTRQGLQP